MNFYAMLKLHGKKTPKRWGNKKLLLYGVSFRYRKWVKLPESFLKQTGLIDPEISGAVAKSLASNYGLAIRKLGDAEATKLNIPSPESSYKRKEVHAGSPKSKVGEDPVRTGGE